LVIAFANFLSVSDYGVYKYILSVYSIFALAGLSGAGPAIIKSVAEGNENIFKPALKTQIRWGILGTIGLITLSIYYFTKGNDLFGYGFIIAAVALPFFESLNTYQHILSGKKRFDIQIKYYSGTRIISALSLISALYFSDSILVILSAYFIPYILANLIFGTLAMKELELNDKFDQEAISYAKHLSLVNAVSFVVNYLDGIIVFQFLGPIQLAIYSMASAPSARVQSFFSIIPDISFPKYTERPIEEIKATILPKIAKASMFCTVIVVVYMVFVPFFFKWFLPQYESSILFAQLFAVPLMWYPLALLPRVLLAKGATKFIYYNNIIGSIMQLVVMFFSIYFYGLIGAIIGRIIVSIISYYVIYYYFRKL
jgi:O-antigen/teichoic acid export membrane protein